jgi:hypothetical protein
LQLYSVASSSYSTVDTHMRRKTALTSERTKSVSPPGFYYGKMGDPPLASLKKSQNLRYQDHIFDPPENRRVDPAALPDQFCCFMGAVQLKYVKITKLKDDSLWDWPKGPSRDAFTSSQQTNCFGFLYLFSELEGLHLNISFVGTRTPTHFLLKRPFYPSRGSCNLNLIFCVRIYFWL